MDLQFYVILVAVVAIIYATTTRILQLKLVDRTLMESVQKESKELKEAQKKANERGDKAEAERLMKKQMELLPRMNKAMIQQFKPMIFIIGLFFMFTYAINFVNPMVGDDVEIIMSDDGTGCDKVAGDKVFSACYEISGDDYGKWTYSGLAYNDGKEIGLNHTYFFYGERDVDTYVENGWGENKLALSTDKELYQPGETVHLYADAPAANGIKATLDHGTWFYVDLPVTIPVFNVQRIYQPYWWFILISLILGLVISFALKKIVK